MTDLETGQQLGANPLFNFSKYDHEHDHDAKAWTHPAWLEENWYRQLVTPKLTQQLLADGRSGNKAAGMKLIELRKPFLLPIPEWLPHVALLRERHRPEHKKQPAAGLQAGNVPPSQYQSLANRHARIGLRAQRRYRILPEVWQARWDIAEA